MARDITSGFQTEIEASSLSPIIMIKAEFDSGDTLAWSGYGNLVYDGDTFVGTGTFLSISEIEETQKLQANSVSFALSGIPSSYVSLALSEDFQGRKITAWFAVLDSSGSIISNPYQIFSGRMDSMEIYDDGSDSRITVSAESDLIDLRLSRERRYTPEDQKIDYQDDDGLDFVPLVAEVEVIWGNKTP